ncbi:hypothetical protein OG754_39825 (plasmid) [Streptomyces decoyicus]|uniref:hypothetical protein n=1 Tax=Streptomyces decoyicus TaxID=249567 RepID=UPI002E34EEF5|nr:hypothetical protein [Streptomyces decoyicus]
MANPLSAPRRTPSRGSRNAALAAALLVAATLAGTVSPAAAADGTAEKLYASNEDVEKEMADKAPVADLESVMSYPKGLERDKDGNLVPVTQEDVKARVKYEPAQALTDAKAAAKNWSENTDNNSDAREMIKQLSDSALTEPDVIGADTRDDNIATAMAEVNSSASFCEGVNAGGHQNAAKANPCVFVGKLDTKGDSKWPKLSTGAALAGGGKKTYKTSEQITDESSTTAGWQVGGKVTPKVSVAPGGDGGAGGEFPIEGSFTYSVSSTSLSRKMTSTEENYEVNFPAEKWGELQGRRAGAFYLGYLLVDYKAVPGAPGTHPETEHIKAIPARVFVQSPKADVPLAYFNMQKPQAQ